MEHSLESAGVGSVDGGAAEARVRDRLDERMKLLDSGQRETVAVAVFFYPFSIIVLVPIAPAAPGQLPATLGPDATCPTPPGGGAARWPRRPARAGGLARL
jgi:hypothetical protein